MRNNKQSANRQYPLQAKFLTRHHSEASFTFFPCCSSTVPTQLEKQSTYVEKTNANKLSMKNILKKSAIITETNQKSIVNESRCNLTAKNTENLNTSNLHSRKPSSTSNFSQRFQNQKTVRKPGGNIKFSYQQDNNPANNSIHNYHTTNYIVQRYIVQPQEMNIIVKNNQNPSPPNQGYNFRYQEPNNQHLDNRRYFDLSHQFQEGQEYIDSPKWNNQHHNHKIEPNYQNNPQYNPNIAPNACTFSFGHHQKKAYMAKYMREVESKRQSQNSKESVRPSLDFDRIKLQEGLKQKEGDEIFLKADYRNQNFSHNIREEVSAIDSDQSDFGSQNSEVIDDYQSIMRRMSETPSGRRHQA